MKLQTSSFPSRLICPADLHWVRDQEQVILVDSRNGAGQRLQGLAAAVWQWLPWDTSYSQLVEFTADLLQIEPAAAAARIDTLLRDWIAQGWLVAESETWRG